MHTQNIHSTFMSFQVYRNINYVLLNNITAVGVNYISDLQYRQNTIRFTSWPLALISSSVVLSDVAEPSKV